MTYTDKLSAEQLCNMIDHTLLKPFASKEDFIRLCNEAKENHFAMVAINPYPVKMCSELLKGSGVHVGAAIAFPLGQLSIVQKCAETISAISDGADEIDYVVNISKVKDHDYAYIEEEMLQITDICRKFQKIVKVIFENCYLEEDEIIQLAKIAAKVKPDFIKTSTGFGSSGATLKDVRLMKQYAGPDVKVKAAGGIRDLDTCLKMIEEGAERIGTSSSLAILEEFRKRRHPQ